MKRASPFPKNSVVVLTLAALAVPPLVSADPPPWAPAHGWRKKHDPYYQGYTGKQWPDDYGVIEGRCDRAAVGAVIGAAAGAAIGSQVGKGNGRTVAVILGTVLGGVVGAHIGREMDNADRACFGHALELAPERQSVSWTNPDTGVAYRVTPGAGFNDNGRPCRAYTTRVTIGGRNESVRGKACRDGDGVWRTL